MQKRALIFVKNFYIDISLFFFFFATYTFTSSRAVVHADSGDFLSAAATFGVPHNPGYPFYMILSSSIFALTHSVWAVNLLSVVFGAVSVVMVYKIIKLLTKSAPSSLFGALALGIYPSFWFYSQVAQIHILHVMILSFLYYFLIRAVKTGSFQPIYFAALTFGLGVSNNHTIIFTLPSIFMCLFFLRGERNFLKKLLKALAISILGLAPYLYIFISSSTNPAINWGRVHDVGSFLYVFFRGDYGTTSWVRPEPYAPFIHSPFIYYLKSDFLTSWHILPFAFVSLYSLFKKQKTFLIVFVGFIFMGPVFRLLMNVPIRSVVHQANTEQFLAYSFFFVSIFAGVGLYHIIQYFHVKKTVVLNACVIAFFIIPFTITFQKVRLDNNNITAETSKFELSEVKKNGVILTWSDGLFLPAMYHQYAIGFRKDIRLVQLGLINLEWYRENLKEQDAELLNYFKSSDFNYEKACSELAEKNLLYIYPWYPEFDTYFGKECEIIPYGLIAKVVKRGSVSVEEIKKTNDRFINEYLSKNPVEKSKNSYSRTRESLFYISEHLNYIGIYYLRFGKEDWAYDAFVKAREISPDQTNSILNESAILFKRGETDRSIKILEEGIRREPATDRLYKNLGIIELNAKNEKAAYDNFRKYEAFRPNDPDNKGILQFISSYEAKYHSQQGSLNPQL